MANTKAIKGKIKAIGSIKKITKTMEMVAVSKMKKSVSETVDLSDYIKEIKFIIENIKSKSKEKHVLLDNSKIDVDAPELVIIFASNKGLCGSFNTNLYKQTKKLIEENPNIKQAICFGKFAEKIARKLDLEIKLSYLEIERITKTGQINKIENFVRGEYLNQKVRRVHAVYTNFIKMGIYIPQSVVLYPVDKNLNNYLDEPKITSTEEIKLTNQIYTFEPSIETIIDKVIPKIVSLIIFSYVLESRASENSSRSFAMKRASESASELLGSLKITYNKIRQDSITAEIAEISAGAQL